MAAGLRAGGVGRGDTVGVCLPRDPRLVAALLGVLAAGAAYVPVDHRHVSRRTDRALADAGARVVVDTSTWDALAAAEPLPAPLGVGPDDLAYVLFTSGSTGTPKGVAVEHGALAAMLGWAQEEFGEDEARVSSAVASVGFDFSVLELLLPLSRGGTVLLADDLLALAEHPRFAELTLLNAVPAAAALLLDDPLPRSVRTVAFGGERLSRALADRAHANPGVTRVLNLYGPTENTVVATAAEVPAGSRDQPVIGTAVGGTRTHVVGADGRLGDAGELWLTGTQLARGYVGRPDLMAAAFVELDGERAYRTGDQVRLVDGVLHYVGRDDDQVKVRGVRIELGEVEAALSELAGARRVAAAVVGDRLVGYVDGDLDTGVARGALRDLLPEFLVPDQLVTTELVLGSTGKIDRSALPRPSDRGAADAGGPPRGAAEELVAAVVGDLLDLAVLGRDAPLDEAGLHSLAAARLVQRLAEQDGRQLAPGSALAGATVADVARALEAAPRTAAAAAPPPARPGEMVPLTDLQRRMWLQRVLADDPAVTSVGLHLRLDPAPAAEVLRAALLRLTEVHPTLRMAVDDGPTGPRGRWLEPGVLLQEGTDLDGLAPVRLDGSEPTLRARLVRDGDRADLALVADHVALDGWGAGVLASDLDRLLCGEDVEAPPVALWQLAADEVVVESARPRGSADAADPLGTGAGPRTAARRGARISRPAGPDVPTAAHLAALVTVLHRLTGRDDVEVGVVAARRHLPGTARVVAPLLAVLPVHVPVRGDDTLEGLTGRCAAAIATALGTLDHERPDAPAPSVVLSVQPDLPVRHRRVAVVGELDTGGSQADLTLLVNRGCDGAELVLEHDPVVDHRTAAALLERYQQVLTAPTTTTVDDAPVLLAAEVAALDAWGTGPACGPTADLVEQVLAQDRTRAAVRCGDRSRTYADLVDSALDLAAHLEAHGVAPGDTVGVCLGRDVDLPGRLLGVLLAGAAYVPLDPEHPRARTDFVRSDAGCRVTLVDTTTRSADGAPGDALDVTVVPQRPLGWTAPASDPDSLAYVLHTSGSTGTPKGVAVRRRNLSWFVASMALVPGIGEQDRVLAMTTLTFDISATEIWAPLARGGEVLVVDRETARDAALLAQRSAGATVVQGTPTTWRMLVDSGWEGGDGVTAVAGGEVLPPDLAAALLDRCAAVWNGYGPTEATVYATMHRVAPSPAGALAPVPIGAPVPGARVRVVDPSGRRVPPGTVGELWVGGRGVTAGYLGRDELTAERFREADGETWYTTGDLVRWTPDGTLDYLGRSDDQIKVRGHRIEPAEVETVLRTHAAVSDVAVGGRGESLVAWWVPVADAGQADGAGRADGAELARHAAAALPGHLVPSRWVRVDALPVGPSGKTDRRALPDPRPESGSGGPPRGPVEELVAELWCRVLDVPEVERDAGFFALGGHSLAVTRVTAALRDELDLAVPAATLFEHPTLSGFAAQVTAALLQEDHA